MSALSVKLTAMGSVPVGACQMIACQKFGRVLDSDCGRVLVLQQYGPASSGASALASRVLSRFADVAIILAVWKSRKLCCRMLSRFVFLRFRSSFANVDAFIDRVPCDISRVRGTRSPSAVFWRRVSLKSEVSFAK